MANFDATKDEAVRQAMKLANKAAIALSMEDNLEKAQIRMHEQDRPTKNKSIPTELTFLFNPSTIKMNRGMNFTPQGTLQKSADAGAGKTQEFTGEASRTLEIGPLVFDTYFDRSGEGGARASVRKKYIQPLEKMMQAITLGSDQDSVRPPRVLFIWGKFIKEDDEFNGNGWYINSVDTEYTMFLEDGTPVRAKVSLKLIEAAKEPKTSSNSEALADEMTTITVGQFENAFTAVKSAGGKYKDVLKICALNGVDDPLDCGGKTLSWNPKDFT